MKRRSHDIHPEDPSPIRTSFPEALHRDRGRSPVTRLDSRTIRDDGPKTSEYAFFKKMKKDAGQIIDSQLIQREKNQLNKLNTSECCRVVEGTKMIRNISKPSEGTNITRNCSRDFRSPLSVRNVSSKELSQLSIKNVSSKSSRSPLHNNVTHINLDSFLTPFGRAANNSVPTEPKVVKLFLQVTGVLAFLTEVNVKNTFSAIESMCSIEYWLEIDGDKQRLGVLLSNQNCPFAFASLADWLTSCFDLGISNWSQSDQVGLFSRKREKLRQWAHNSFPEIEELCPKGYDLISILLSRLLPWSNENNSCRSAESAPAESNTKTELLACPMSDIPSKKLYRWPKRNIMEVEYIPYMENGTSSYWLDKSRETMLSNICSPTYKNHSTLQKNLELPNYELRRKNLTSCIGGKSMFGFPFVRHGYSPPFATFKELDDLHDPSRTLPGREPHLLPLEWDSVKMNERSLSATCQNTNWTIIPAVRSSWDDQQSQNNWCESFGTHELCSSTVQGNDPLDFYTLLPPNGTGYDKHELGRSILEEQDEMAADHELCSSPIQRNYPQDFYTLLPTNSTSYDKYELGRSILEEEEETVADHELCSSLVLQRNYPQDFCTSLPPNSTSYDIDEHGRSIFEEEEEMVADLNHLPLTLSHSSKCCNLIADCDLYEIACKGSKTSNTLASPVNQFGFMSKALYEEDSTPGFGTHLFFALDVEWNCLQSSDLRGLQCLSTCRDFQVLEKGITYSNFINEDEFDSSSCSSSYISLMSSEDMVDIHDRRSFYFQLSRDKDEAYPLLLDKSSWEDCTEETFDSDNQVKCL
ncbi:hypothetical protein DITRI_Ditri13aG0111500 [Diplodiscus trichospermus]